MSEEDQSSIPITTIARLFKELSFKKDDTRITRPTLDLAAEYIKLFINEAVLRANEERILEGDSLTKVDGIDNIEDKSQPGTAAEEEEEEEEADEIDIDDVVDPEIIEPNTQDQFGTKIEFSNNTLDSRHLEKVAGILILDF